MNRKKVHVIFSRLRDANPNPTTELEYTTPFELLVAVILSAQATDKSVNLATRVLFKHANTPQAISKLGVAGLSRYIKTIGLYNAKAKNVISMCERFLKSTAEKCHVRARSSKSFGCRPQTSQRAS